MDQETAAAATTASAPLHGHVAAAPPLEAARPDRRFTFIDGLRGVACLMVVIFHFAAHTSLAGPILSICPKPLQVLVTHGYLGVQIFFVLSGFVIAYSQRGIRVTARYLGNFALRRSLRLDPPYWVAIALTLLLAAASNWFLRDRVAAMPGVGALLANMFYVHMILGSTVIIPPSWTLCLEVQFYVLLTILVGAAQSLTPRGRERFLGAPSPAFLLTFLPLALGSLCVGIDYAHQQRLEPYFISHWYAFFLGAMIWWACEGLVSSRWLWVYLGTIVAFMVFVIVAPAFTNHREPAVVLAAVLATGLAIYGTACADHLHDWLATRWVQFFGMISYSLYLLHAPLGNRVMNLGKRMTGDRAWLAMGWFIVAFALSVGSSYLLYRFVERPGVRLGKRFKRQ